MCRQQQHPHFSLLLTWCSLLTVAVVAMAVTLVISTTRQQNATKVPEMQERQQADAVIAPTGATCTSTTANNASTTATRRHIWHIQLTYDSPEKGWIQDLQIHDSTTSVFLHNGSVTLDTGGLYYFYALTTFHPCNNKKKKAVLVRNEIPGKKKLELSEVSIEGSMSLSKLISCEKGDSLMLEVNPVECLRFSPHKTYWGLFLLS